MNDPLSESRWTALPDGMALNRSKRGALGKRDIVAPGVPVPTTRPLKADLIPLKIIQTSGNRKKGGVDY
jgi:hypothetical protein